MYCEIITTISLVNIHHYTKLQIFFFFVVRTFKIYSPSSFQIYSIVLLTIVTVLYITSPGHTCFMTRASL